jgi:hypothetical protein
VAQTLPGRRVGAQTRNPRFQRRPSPLRSVPGFVGVANRNAWEKLWRSPEAAFRQSPAFQADEFAVATWLRLGELEAAQLRTDPFDRAAFRIALDEARGLMTGAPDEFFPAMVDLCAQAGVALVLVSEVKGAREWSESLDVADQGPSFSYPCCIAGRTTSGSRSFTREVTSTCTASAAPSSICQLALTMEGPGMTNSKRRPIG